MALAENGGTFPLTKAKYSFNVEVHEIDHQDEAIQWDRATAVGTVLHQYVTPSCSLNPRPFNFHVTVFDIPLNSGNIAKRRSRFKKREYHSANDPSLDTLSKSLREGPPDDSYRIVFNEDISKDSLQKVGAACGLEAGDWLRATRWANLPTAPKFDVNGAWMFLEITTMWKRKPCTENYKAPAKTSIFTPWKTVSPCSQEAGITDRSHQWRPRRIAVLFSKKQKPTGTGQAWTFLVLVEPSEEELLFSYRQVERDDASRNASNAQCSTGRCYYNVEEKPLRDLISCLARELAKGTELHGFVKKLAKDIFWGWEEFLNKVMQIPAMKNGSQWRKTLDATDPCWDLFSYKLILNEVRYLTKAVEFLKGAVESNLFPTSDFNELEMDLAVVKGDVEEAKTVLKDTIDMIYNFVSIREAGCAARSGYNMEYLAILAAIFLPMTLWTGIFGMNINELTGNSPEWWVPVAITLPSTTFLCGLIFAGKKAWISYRKNKNAREWNRRYA